MRYTNEIDPDEMKCDEAIEKVLAGLRDCDPPPAMDRRILDAMQAKAAEPETRRRAFLSAQGLLRLYRQPAIARPLVLASVLCALGLTALWMYFSSTNHAIQLSVARQPQTAPITNASQLSPSQGISRQHSNQIAQDSRPGSSRFTISRAVASELLSSAQRKDTQAGSVSETVSFPAPPLPLTQQERLLLQIAHRGDARNLASLTDAAEEARDLQQQKQFQEFFKPPPNLLVQPQPPDPDKQDAQNQQSQEIAANKIDGGTK